MNRVTRLPHSPSTPSAPLPPPHASFSKAPSCFPLPTCSHMLYTSQETALTCISSLLPSIATSSCPTSSSISRRLATLSAIWAFSSRAPRHLLLAAVASSFSAACSSLSRSTSPAAASLQYST
ncbi:unnamed protein product [Closterium sp. NIES-53]